MTPRQRKADEPATAGPVSTFGMPLMVGTAAMESWMQIGNEAVRFLADRLQQDLKTQRAMMSCTTLAEMQQVQAEFFKSAQDQYAGQARRMMELAGKAATAGVTSAPATKPLGYDDVPV